MAYQRVESIQSGYLTVRKGNRRTRAASWVHSHRFYFALCTALILFSFAFTFVWANHQSVQAGYTLARLHADQTKLKELNRKYKVELANLTSLDRLEDMAKKQLGLVTPSPEQVQVIE